MHSFFRSTLRTIIYAVLVMAMAGLSAEAQKFSIVYNFDVTHGQTPQAGLVRDSSGNLYGTTASGGSASSGVVFKINAKGKITVLHTFNISDGSFPRSDLTLNNKTLYGTTLSGGTTGAGTVFRISTSGSGFKTLYSFTGQNDGSNPGSGVIQDLQGNLYLAQGNIVKIDRAGNTASYVVAGGAVWIDLGPDQRTMFYTTSRGDIKSYDVVSQTQGPNIAVGVVARNVRALADRTIMFDAQGTIQHWGPACDGCLYKEKFTYQIPANADSLSLDPDGISFWTINTYYDTQNQLGNADVYRTNIKTGDPMGSFSLQPLTNGRYYSMSLGVNGDGMGSSAVATPSIGFASRTVGTTSLPKKAVLTNIGVVQVVVRNVTVTGDFAVAKNGCVKPVKSGLSCNVMVTFTPTPLRNLCMHDGSCRRRSW